MTRTLYHFHGGVHPEEHKLASSVRPIAVAPIPSQLVVPVHQHIGESARPCVTVGERVLKGQVIAQPEGYISVAIHAPTSGVVTAIAPHAVPHPSGLLDMCIQIQPDGQDQWIAHHPINYLNMAVSSLRNVLRDMGVAGLGGAVFPTFIKLHRGKAQKVPILLLNGGECEPWITCDDLVMRERSDEVLHGAAVMRHLLQAEHVLVGIEDNKPQAIAAMRAAAARMDFAVEVVSLPTLYPSGGTKQMIKVLTGREVPSGGRSTDAGVATFNVGTALAVHRAINHGEPMISRVMTLTGNVAQPQNYEVLLGTPMNELVKLAGAGSADVTGYVMGGPMMGVELSDLGVPVVKASNCLLVKSAELFPPPPDAMECIRCTRCADVCPAELQPQALYWYARSNLLDKAQQYRLFDCIECGCCSYVCPSHIPLVHYYRYAKSEIADKQNGERAANHARERHEFRLARQERDEQERVARLAQKAAAKPALPGAEGGADQAAIQAALARTQPESTATPQSPRE